MNHFQTINADMFEYSPFRIIGKDWMLITAKKDEKVNCMTASWGGMGVMWNKNVVFIVVRKSRYTKEFLDASDSFSLTFFDRKKYGKMLNFMGTVSGRDENKIEKCGLTVTYFDGIPYFNEAAKVILCKKMCRQPIQPDSFFLKEIDERWYPDQDYHDLYIGEIVEILSSDI